jgi:hypothetical protein
LFPTRPVKEKPVIVTVAKYEPIPDRLTLPTPHYVMPDPACTFTAQDGRVSHTFCVKQIADALDGERAQVDSANVDKACIAALSAGKKCQ